MDNPFEKKSGPFPHESKSQSTIDREVSELEKMIKLEEPKKEVRPGIKRVLRGH
jgi:hypothetical protein